MSAPHVAARPALVHGHDKKLALLDLARAIAGAWVLLAHVSIILGRHIFLLSEGRVPVDVFIFLSGFLIFHLLRRRSEAWSLSGVASFYARRLFRIAPCFYFALLLYAGYHAPYYHALVRAEGCFGTAGSFSNYVEPIHGSDLLLHLIFLHGLQPARATAIFGPAWSLSLEMQFYAVAPFLVSWLQRRPGATLLGAFAINAAAWFLFGNYGRIGWYSHHFFPTTLPDRLFLFCFGSMSSLYFSSPTRRHGWWLGGAAVGSFLLFPFDSTLLCVALALGLLFIARAPGNGFAVVLQRLAGSRATGLAAEWSYSLYLIHPFCIAMTSFLLWRWLQPGQSGEATTWVFAATSIALSVFSAAAMFMVIERPARLLGKHLTRVRLMVG